MMTFAAFAPPTDTEPPGTEVATPPLLDLLLEHPEIPAAKIAAPATATVSPRFTFSPLPDVCGPSELRTVSAVCGLTGLKI
jgi:hypothetical protein